MAFIDPPWETIHHGTFVGAAYADEVGGESFGEFYLTDDIPPESLQYYDFLAFSLGMAPIPEPDFGPSGPRVRSRYSETIGSLMEQTSAQAVEVALDEAFFFDTELDPTLLTPFYEAMNPGTPVAVRYPLPVHNSEYLNDYRARTNLGRLADTIAPAVLTLVSETSIASPTGTLQQVLQYLADLWETRHPWLSFEPIPDLRFAVDTGNYSGENGVLRTEAISLPQLESRRLTIREVIDELLTLTPAAIRQTDTGSIEIIPFHGPDAPSSPELVLADSDVVSVTQGPPDPSQVYNAARVISTGSEFSDDVDLTAPAFAAASWFEIAKLEAGGPNAPDPFPTGVGQWPAEGAGFQQWGELGVQPFDSVLVSGTNITIDWVGRVYSLRGTGTNLWEEGNASGSITLLRDSFPDFARIDGSVGEFGGIGGWSFYFQWSFQWVDGGVRISVVGPTQFQDWRFASVIEWSVSGTAWTPRTSTTTGIFALSNGDFLPGAGGSNALVTSEDHYGIRELSVRSDVFALTPVQAMEVAKGLVVHHINPKTVRTVVQSWEGGFAVKPHHVGRLVELPGAMVARVQERTYSDDFTALSLESSFTAVQTDVVVIPGEAFTTDNGRYFLTFDNGENIYPS